jgi:hypothetical protein
MDSYCVELPDVQGKLLGRCVFDSAPCPENAVSVCVDGWVATCEKTGYPEYLHEISFKISEELCIEVEEDEILHAEYVLSTTPCPDGAVSACVDRIPAPCGETGYPIILTKRPDLNGAYGGSASFGVCKLKCVMTDADGIPEARCALTEEPCTVGDEHLCIDNAVATCVGSEYPIALEYCLDSQQCVVTSNGASCQPL